MKAVYDPAKDPKVQKRLADYVATWMEYNGWTKAIEVEARAKKLGVAEGVSDATISNILNKKPFRMQLYSMRNLAITLGRPPEEIFAIAIGKSAEQKEDADIVSLAETYRSLTDESERIHFQRNIRTMIREMNSTD
jgi:transcriptional regulator with XRE-family HTH domain